MPFPILTAVLAAMAGGAATSGVSKLLAGDAPKPQGPNVQLDSIEQAKQQMAQQQQGIVGDPMQDDILQRYLSQVKMKGV